MSSLRVIISCGGTGGHIYPAVAVADALLDMNVTNSVLFVGAEGKMEMDKVPENGYVIEGLPIRGLQRNFSLSNLVLPFRIIRSIWKSIGIIRKFKPDVIVGFGGYASAAVVFTGKLMFKKTMIQEQNSYPGITNRILSKMVKKVCVAFEGMNEYFPEKKVVLTGNPIRAELTYTEGKLEDARYLFRLDPSRKVILALGGSLGARTINNCMMQLAPLVDELKIQLLWQCGTNNYEKIRETVPLIENPNVRMKRFIDRMDLAYVCADLVISRAGALSISEITALNKPSILIPSPNVAEDHQTKNAKALVEQKAAILLEDREAETKFLDLIRNLLSNPEKISALENNIKKVYRNKNAANDIALEIKKLVYPDV